MRRLEDRQGVRGYPGFADRVHIENGEKFAKQLGAVARPKGVQAVLCDRAVDVIVVPDVPDSAVGEDAGPALVGIIVQGEAAFLVLKFAEQVSLELLERGFVVVAGLGAVRIG